MLMLYDRDEKLIASLKYNNVERKRELNGLNTLEFETSKEVEFGQRVLFRDRNGLWNEYIIIDYFKNHENNDITYSVYCEDSTSELYWYFVDDLKPRGEACSSVLRRILEGTRFEIGYVDDFDKKSFNLYRESVKSCLWKMLDQYGAEINVRIVVDKTGILHRYIDLRKKIGRDVGKRFTYKKDTGSIKKTTSIKDLATALHGYGKGEEIVKEDGTPSRNDNKIGGGDYGRKIDFSEINGGKTYVEDNEARLKYGIGKERRHIFGQADFPDCEDKHELLRLTKEKLKELSKPKITYELNVEDISRYEGYIGEGVDLGDIVYVIDKEIDTRVQTRVISIKDNPIEEIEDSEIVLGNFIKDLSDNLVDYEKLKSVFENDRNKFNQELDKLANGVKSSYIQKILDKFNRELNETGGWVYAEEGEGLLILNAPKEGNPTQAINLKGGKIAIANHKNSDGSFAYETFGDGDGFTANLIRAGVLRGGKVFFNLEDGTFLIGESRTNYSMYWDGNTLHLRNVDIDLENNRTIQNIISEGNSSKYEIEQRKEEIKQAREAIESAKRQLNDSISNVQEEVDGNKSSQDSKNKILDQQILDLKSSVKITDGKISTNVESLSKTIEERYNSNRNAITAKDKDIRTYITNNYSTKTQTDELISSKVASVKTDITNLDSNLRRYVESNYSTKTQTDKLIESTVKSFKDDMSKYESRFTQLKDEISLEVSSKQSGMYKNLIKYGWKWVTGQGVYRYYKFDENRVAQGGAYYIESNGDIRFTSNKKANTWTSYDFILLEAEPGTKEYTLIFEPSEIKNTVQLPQFKLDDKFNNFLSYGTVINKSDKVYKLTLTEGNQNKIPYKLQLSFKDSQAGTDEDRSVVIPQRKLALVKGWHPNLTWDDVYFPNDQGIEEVRSELKVKTDKISASVSDKLKGLESRFDIRSDQISSKVTSLEDDIINSYGDIRTYVDSNFSTKTQTKDLISSSVSSLNTRIGNAESRITQTSNEISSKVSKNEFGTKVRQSASDIQIAWNNISNYIQFENGSIGIYNRLLTSYMKRSMFDENGIHFYRDGYYMGKIGTNEYESDSSKKSLVFDLEYEAAAMSWNVKKYKDYNTYENILVYSNDDFDGYKKNTLYLGCNMDMNGYTLKNVNFEGGGLTGHLYFAQITSMNSDGTANEYATCNLNFKNGILVGGSWAD